MGQSEGVSEGDGPLVAQRQSPHGEPVAGAAGTGRTALSTDTMHLCAASWAMLSCSGLHNHTSIVFQTASVQELARQLVIIYKS